MWVGTVPGDGALVEVLAQGAKVERSRVRVRGAEDDMLGRNACAPGRSFPRPRGDVRRHPDKVAADQGRARLALLEHQGAGLQGVVCPRIETFGEVPGHAPAAGRGDV